MTNDLIIADGRTYVVVFDGAHRGRDADLFCKVDWQDPKSPVLVRETSDRAETQRARRRSYGRLISMAEVRARVAQIRAES